jgi:hypothetical protein
MSSSRNFFTAVEKFENVKDLRKRVGLKIREIFMKVSGELRFFSPQTSKAS